MRNYLTTLIIFIQYDLVWRVGWRWLLDDANKVNRTWLLKVGDRLNEYLALEKRERNMKKPQSFKEIWKKKHFDGLGVEHAQKLGEVI